MNTRIIRFQVSPGRLEEVENAYQNVIVPEAEQHPGFAGLLLLSDEDTGDTLEVTLWQDNNAKRESEKTGGLLDWKLSALEAITGEAPTVTNYNLRLMS